jgi:hypothetical protein
MISGSALQNAPDGVPGLVDEYFNSVFIMDEEVARSASGQAATGVGRSS